MANNGLSGMGGKVLGNLGEIVKDTVAETAKMGVGVAKGTIENVVGGGDDQVKGSSNGILKQVQDDEVRRDPMVEMKQKKEAERRRGLNRVRQELQAFFERGQQEEAQETRVEEREEEVEKQEEKQKVESERDAQIAQAQRSGGGTGEIISKKN